MSRKLPQIEYEKEIARELLKVVRGEQDLGETLKFVENSHKIRRMKNGS